MRDLFDKIGRAKPEDFPGFHLDAHRSAMYIAHGRWELLYERPSPTTVFYLWDEVKPATSQLRALRRFRLFRYRAEKSFLHWCVRHPKQDDRAFRQIVWLALNEPVSFELFHRLPEYSAASDHWPRSCRCSLQSLYNRCPWWIPWDSDAYRRLCRRRLSPPKPPWISVDLEE